MWCTPLSVTDLPPILAGVLSSLRVLRCQHLLSRPGSHQHFSSSFSAPQVSTLRHLLIISPVKVGRCDRLMIALMVPGLFTWSCGIAEVSRTPGRACANTCHSRLVRAIPEPKSSDIRVYWLPIRPLMFSHRGRAGFTGGLRGSNAMWHEPQVVPMRYGGSTDASASLLTLASEGMPVCLTSFLLKPSQPAEPALSCRHFFASKRGLGNLRMPSAPVEVPNLRSHGD